LVAYACVTVWLAVLTRQANQIEIESLRVSQGADVMLSYIGFDEKHGVVAYPLQNAGQRTATIFNEHLEQALITRPQNILIQLARVDIDDTFEVPSGKQIGAGSFTIPHWQPDEMKAINDTTHTIVFGGTMDYTNGLGKFTQTKEYRFCLASQRFGTTLEWAV
jgi:hypothetical protein